MAGQGDTPQLSQSYVAGVFTEETSFRRTPVIEEVLAWNNNQYMMFPSKVVSLDQVRQSTKLAKLKGSPNSEPEIVQDPQYGEVKMTALYTHQKGGLSVDELVLLRRVGENPGSPLAGYAKKALADKAGYMRDAALRTQEAWNCGLLQGGTYTQKVNGINRSVTTGITVQNMGGNFATASTDIPGWFNKALVTHEKQSKRKVDLVICHVDQRNNFALNDKIRDFLIRQPSAINEISLIPRGLIGPLGMDARWIIHNETYTDEDNQTQQYWSSTKMAFISLGGRQPLIMAGTHPIIRPDTTENWESPYTQHQWVKNSNGQLWIRELGTFLFGMLDITAITVWNTAA